MLGEEISANKANRLGSRGSVIMILPQSLLASYRRNRALHNSAPIRQETAAWRPPRRGRRQIVDAALAHRSPGAVVRNGSIAVAQVILAWCPVSARLARCPASPRRSVD